MGEGAGVMFELDSDAAVAQIFASGGWTLLTAVNLMLFSLVHNPCSTTIYTIWKETRSAKWTSISSFLPVGMGFLLCFLVAQIWRLFRVRTVQNRLSMRRDFRSPRRIVRRKETHA